MIKFMAIFRSFLGGGGENDEGGELRENQREE